MDGLIRKEDYELPVDAIREMIVNAHCHRNLTDESCVQVAIFDDRLEVTSPGGLYNGLTFEEAMNGHSKLRNRAVANVFNQIGFIEAWGTGIQRIQDAAKEYELPKPEFIEMPDFFRVNLFRKPLSMQSVGETSVKVEKNIGNVDKTSVEHRQNIGDGSVEHRLFYGIELNTTQRKIVEILSENPEITGASLSEQIGISKRNIEANIKKLREFGILIRHGSSKGGYWEVSRKR